MILRELEAGEDEEGGAGAGLALEALAAEGFPLGVLCGGGEILSEAGVLLHLGGVEEEFFAADDGSEGVQVPAFHEGADGPGGDVEEVCGFLSGDEEGRGCAGRIGRGRKEGHANFIACFCV